MTPVIDQPLKILSQGQLTGTTSASNPWAPGTGGPREGYLTVTLSPNAAGPCGIGPSGVTTSTGFPLWPGQSRQVRYIDVTQVYVALGSNSDVLGWVLEVE